MRLRAPLRHARSAPMPTRGSREWTGLRIWRNLAGMAAPRQKSELKVRRVPNGAQLVLAEAGSWVLVLRGHCVVRSAKDQAEPIPAGTLLLREADQQPAPDLRVAQALALMSSQPGKRWTVSSLARSVGLSRAAFAKRFVLATGMPPLRTLCQVRLELAAGLLQSSEASLAELAREVGYASEFAFSRAFKRKYGVAPSFFRRRAGVRPATVALLRAA